MIRALFLDFDGLIVDTESAYLDAVGDVHRAHQRLFDKRSLTKVVGSVGATVDPWKGFGPGAPRAMLETELARFHADRQAALEVMPGVSELIAETRKHGFLVGCASNSSRTHVLGYLQRFGLKEKFDAFACIEDVDQPKPAPDVYLRLLKVLELPPADAVALEDSGPGVAAARAAGLWVGAVPTSATREHNFEGADTKFDTLAGKSLAMVFSAVRSGRRRSAPPFPSTGSRG